jgi:hypothetical protein
MLELKVPIIGASVGFVLSFLVGLVSSATLSAVILRAFIMAILFGTLAFAGRAVIRRFIPELLEENSPEEQSVDTAGKMVDITVGGRQDDSFSYDARASADENSMVPDFLEPDSREGASSGHADRATDQEPSEAMPAAGRPDPVRDSGKKESPAFTGGLDVLPDLQDFAPDKKAGAEAEIGDDADTFQVDSGIGSGDSVFVNPDSGNISAETETMAKAIRTILSRDAT